MTAHHIKRLTFETDAPSKGAARQVNAALQARYPHIEAVLVQALDQVVPPDHVVQLDRLEVDLGEIDPESSVFTDQLLRALHQALANAEYGQTNTVGQVMRDGPNSGSTDLRTSDLFALLHHYLEQGVLNYPRPGLALEQVFYSLMQQPADRFDQMSQSLMPLLTRPTPLRRFIWQFPQSIVLRLILSVAAARGVSRPDLTMDVTAIPRFVPAALAPGVEDLLRDLCGPDPEKVSPERLKSLIRSAALNLPEKPMTAKLSKEPAQPDMSPAFEEETGDVLSASSAGVILLHPFLQTLFRQLRFLTDQGDFRSVTHQQKAVQTVSYLATGSKLTSEPDLVLAKILSGLPINTPVPAELNLSADGFGECQDLLRAAINHWGALGSTSPEGLQEAFLQRPGLLRRFDTGWNLQMELSGIDILLDQLPWNLGLVKTSYMERPIHVNWRRSA